MASLQKIVPCLWFDTQAEEAASDYVSIFGGDASLGEISRYGKEGFEHHGRPEGSVLSVSFRIAGQDFVGLNGGPQYLVTATCWRPTASQATLIGAYVHSVSSRTSSTLLNTRLRAHSR